MTTTHDQTCRTTGGRAMARALGRNGIDSISVSDDQLRISVTLFGKAPEGLGPGNIRIDGEPGAPVVTPLSVVPCPDPDPEDSECLLVLVDAPGDLSCYRLCVVESDPHGRPGTTPYPGFDQRFSCAAIHVQAELSALTRLPVRLWGFGSPRRRTGDRLLGPRLRAACGSSSWIG